MLVNANGCIFVLGKPEYLVTDEVYLLLSTDATAREELLKQLGRKSVMIGRIGKDKGNYRQILFDKKKSVDLANLNLLEGLGYEHAI